MMQVTRAAFQAKASLNQQATDTKSHTLVRTFYTRFSSVPLPANSDGRHVIFDWSDPGMSPCYSYFDSSNCLTRFTMAGSISYKPFTIFSMPGPSIGSISSFAFSASARN
jgi:hypothetical protein